MRLLLLLLLLSFAAVTARAQQEISVTPESVIFVTNRVRAERGLPPLKIDERLMRAAQAKATDMLSRQYFAHAEWQKFIRQSGYGFCVAGENLGINQREAEEVVRDWLASARHRDNLLEWKYRETGVAVVQGRYKNIEHAIIIVQMFGNRCV